MYVGLLEWGKVQISVIINKILKSVLMGKIRGIEVEAKYYLPTVTDQTSQ